MQKGVTAHLYNKIQHAPKHADKCKSVQAAQIAHANAAENRINGNQALQPACIKK